ncbi:four helix bundle protein [Solitalea longa]|uniref:Four helix bundle protein n=1 Tax=Solitalea longa TaxID=2079460 RepID=A0A2S5AA49_9SPHI|nr:four helix bundle protein [Solitalea longa]POY38993.1 four helix bundle protein [Solitalea longa]
MEKTNKEEFVKEFKARTKTFVVRNINLFRHLPKTTEADIIGKQLLRSSSSVGANYRAACRARSKAEFFAKLSIVVEEADESLFWLEVILETGILPATKLESLIKETEEILSIVAKARKNTY